MAPSSHMMRRAGEKSSKHRDQVHHALTVARMRASTCQHAHALFTPAHSASSHQSCDAETNVSVTKEEY